MVGVTGFEPATPTSRMLGSWPRQDSRGRYRLVRAQACSRCRSRLAQYALERYRARRIGAPEHTSACPSAPTSQAIKPRMPSSSAVSERVNSSADGVGEATEGCQQRLADPPPPRRGHQNRSRGAPEPGGRLASIVGVYWRPRKSGERIPHACHTGATRAIFGRAESVENAYFYSGGRYRD
jgi:hypothetical protein